MADSSNSGRSASAPSETPPSAADARVAGALRAIWAFGKHRLATSTEEAGSILTAARMQKVILDTIGEVEMEEGVQFSAAAAKDAEMAILYEYLLLELYHALADKGNAKIRIDSAEYACHADRGDYDSAVFQQKAAQYSGISAKLQTALALALDKSRPHSTAAEEDILTAVDTDERREGVTAQSETIRHIVGRRMQHLWEKPAHPDYLAARQQQTDPLLIAGMEHITADATVVANAAALPEAIYTAEAGQRLMLAAHREIHIICHALHDVMARIRSVLDTHAAALDYELNRVEIKVHDHSKDTRDEYDRATKAAAAAERDLLRYGKPRQHSYVAKIRPDPYW